MPAVNFTTVRRTKFYVGRIREHSFLHALNLLKHNAAKFEGWTAKSPRNHAGEKVWRCGAESNRRIQVLQTRALPLGYRTI